ncbi:MAG: hypothetical protein ACR2HD_10440 [Solirubrobacteraceae bacterium]
MTSPKLAAHRPDAVAVAIAMGCLGILGLFVALLLTRTLPIIDDNQHAGDSLVVVLRRGQTVCQRESAIPRGVTHLGVSLAVVGASRGGPLSVTIESTPWSSAVSRSRSATATASPIVEAAGRITVVSTGTMPVALNRPPEPGAATICLQNAGPATLELLGDANPVTPGHVTGVPAQGLIGFVYPRSPPTSWWRQLGTIARRFALVKAPLFGSWTLWAVIVAVAAISIVAVEGLRRTLRS